MPAFAYLAAASAVRMASLNLCADEYALLLARPGELVSVTRLAADPLESPLAARTKRVPRNRGELEHVVQLRPSVILTMGRTGRSTRLLAGRLGIRTIELTSPSDIGDVERNLRIVAEALGEPSRADPWLRRIAALKSARPKRQEDAVFVSGGGVSLGPWSPAVEWMALAGLAQRRLAGGKLTLEQLLTDPPTILLRSNYRSGQMSAGANWFDHPVVRRLADRTVRTDGRPWTCAGPLMIDEIERLRRVLR